MSCVILSSLLIKYHKYNKIAKYFFPIIVPLPLHLIIYKAYCEAEIRVKIQGLVGNRIGVGDSLTVCRTVTSLIKDLTNKILLKTK